MLLLHRYTHSHKHVSCAFITVAHFVLVLYYRCRGTRYSSDQALKDSGFCNYLCVKTLHFAPNMFDTALSFVELSLYSFVSEIGNCSIEGKLSSGMESRILPIIDVTWRWLTGFNAFCIFFCLINDEKSSGGVTDYSSLSALRSYCVSPSGECSPLCPNVCSIVLKRHEY